MKTTKMTVAKFVGCVKEKCSVGGIISLRGIYEIPHPEDGTVSLYERHTSQLRGMGWKPASTLPTHNRVWAWIGQNGHFSAVGAHVMSYGGPETVEVTWQPMHEVMADIAAIALVGRAHIPSNLRGIKHLMEPACTVEEATSLYTAEKYPGWSHYFDTGCGKSTLCLNLSEQITSEAERVRKEFDDLLNKELVKRAEWTETRDGQTVPTFFCLKDTEEETIACAIGFGCGISPDYNVPQGWQPSEESRQRLAEMRAEKAQREAKAKEIQNRFMTGWEILRGRYQVALGQLGLTIVKDNCSLQNEFRIGAKNSEGVIVECPAGGIKGPHYRTGYAAAANWLDANASTYDVAGTASHLAKKIQKVNVAKAASHANV